MSHELRTPMNGILGMVELLHGSNLDPQQRADLGTLRGSAETLLNLIRQLLEFTRIGAGTDTLQHQPFRVREFLRDLGERFIQEAEAKGVHTAIRVEDAVPDTLLGDPGGLRQALGHLLENALKFTESGYVSLRVRVLEEEEDQVRVGFSVQDSGIGIAPDRQRAIFEAFEQADTSSTRRYGGVGLGLTLASSVVRRMGGKLEVASELGRGSTFHFELEMPRARIVAPDSPQSSRLAGCLVLVVDGAGAGRTGLVQALEEWGMRVHTAPTAPAAVEVVAEASARGETFELAVIDPRGTELAPFAVAAHLREALGDRTPATLLITAAGQRGDGELCQQLGIGAYLTSPVHGAEVQESLCRLIEGREDSPLVTRHLMREARPLRHVLLADDNPVNRRVASRLLERAGFEVVLAVDGQEAVERCASQRFDFVLMDVQMPRMDGLAATQAIREREAQDAVPRTPIIAVTAHALDEDRVQCLQAGMDGVVSKPIHPDELFEVMRRLSVAPHRHARQAGPPALFGVLDWDQALKRMDGDAVVLHELLHLFLEDSPNMLGRLESALASEDPREIERAAHGLKGSSATISADPVTALALQVERAAKEGRLHEAKSTIIDLQRELQRLLSALATLPRDHREAA